MFFIIILLIAVLIAILLILVFAIRTKAVIDVDNGNIDINVFILRIIKLKRKYIIKHEPDVILKLYTVTRKGTKPVIALPDIIEKIKETEASDVTFVNLLNLLLQSVRKKQKKSAFSYLYRKALFEVGVELRLGLEDAFLTAIACGLINAASGAALAICNTEKHLVRAKVHPEFSNLSFSIKARCIIKMATADIIIGYVIYKKNKNRR